LFSFMEINLNLLPSRLVMFTSSFNAVFYTVEKFRHFYIETIPEADRKRRFPIGFIYIHV
jgi:hypothetical protein